MPSTATVDAHILENHDASVEINRRFGSKASLAFPTSHVALFSHVLKGMLEPMDGLLVKTTGSHVQNSGHVDERGALLCPSSLSNLTIRLILPPLNIMWHETARSTFSVDNAVHNQLLLSALAFE